GTDAMARQGKGGNDMGTDAIARQGHGGNDMDREYMQQMEAAKQRLPGVQDLDVTVLAFAQWLSEMKGRSNSSLQQMLAEMGIIRN
ncbi:unnamed protein product, partial [Polarella glacialis]